MYDFGVLLLSADATNNDVIGRDGPTHAYIAQSFRCDYARVDELNLLTFVVNNCADALRSAVTDAACADDAVVACARRTYNIARGNRTACRMRLVGIECDVLRANNNMYHTANWTIDEAGNRTCDLVREHEANGVVSGNTIYFDDSRDASRFVVGREH